MAWTDMPKYDIDEGDTVTLPDGTKVIVEQIAHDDEGRFFTCTENGEQVWYYTDILDSHPDNVALLD
ncbi:MAG: hypothetical protein ABIQ39_02630 [Ilumatobacteraceae bacterium]